MSFWRCFSRCHGFPHRHGHVQLGMLCDRSDAVVPFQNPELLHDGGMEEFLIRAAASAGFIDPASGFADAGVDAIPAKIHAAMIDVLNFIARSRYSDSLYIKKYREFTKDKETIARQIRDGEES